MFYAYPKFKGRIEHHFFISGSDDFDIRFGFGIGGGEIEELHGRGFYQ